MKPDLQQILEFLMEILEGLLGEQRRDRSFTKLSDGALKALNALRKEHVLPQRLKTDTADF